MTSDIKILIDYILKIFVNIRSIWREEMITLTKNEKLLFLELERKNLIGDIKFLIKKLMGRYSFLDENKYLKIITQDKDVLLLVQALQLITLT